MEKMELKHTLEKIFYGYGENGIQAHYKWEKKFTKTSRKGTISIKAVNSYFIKNQLNSRYNPPRKTTVWPMYHRLPSFYWDWKEQSSQICIKSLFAVALITNYSNGEDRAASHTGDTEQKSSHSWREKSCHLKGSQCGFQWHMEDKHQKGLCSVGVILFLTWVLTLCACLVSGSRIWERIFWRTRNTSVKLISQKLC